MNKFKSIKSNTNLHTGLSYKFWKLTDEYIQQTQDLKMFQAELPVHRYLQSRQWTEINFYTSIGLDVFCSLSVMEDLAEPEV